MIWLINSYGHGGHLLIVPDDRSFTKIIDMKYRLPARLFKGNRDEYPISDTASKKTISLYADIVARFSCVDGGVILDKNMDLIGFGSEAIVDITNISPPSLRFVAYDGHIEADRRFDDNGMRHRACYRLCDLVEDSVVIIFSQDGSIKACTKDNGEVVVFENVGIPFV